MGMVWQQWAGKFLAMEDLLNSRRNILRFDQVHKGTYCQINRQVKPYGGNQKEGKMFMFSDPIWLKSLFLNRKKVT